MDDDSFDYLITATGKTVEEAKEEFRSCYEDMRQHYAKEGKEFAEADFDYKFDMVSFLAYYSKVFSLAGLSRLTGINQHQLSHYLTGRRNPSVKTMEKMQTAINGFGRDLSNVSFI